MLKKCRRRGDRGISAQVNLGLDGKPLDVYQPSKTAVPTLSLLFVITIVVVVAVVFVVVVIAVVVIAITVVQSMENSLRNPRSSRPLKSESGTGEMR
jgi:hypothetical protein